MSGSFNSMFDLALQSPNFKLKNKLNTESSTYLKSFCNSNFCSFNDIVESEKMCSDSCDVDINDGHADFKTAILDTTSNVADTYNTQLCRNICVHDAAIHHIGDVPKPHLSPTKTEGSPISPYGMKALDYNGIFRLILV